MALLATVTKPQSRAYPQGEKGFRHKAINKHRFGEQLPSCKAFDTHVWSFCGEQKSQEIWNPVLAIHLTLYLQVRRNSCSYSRVTMYLCLSLDR